MFNSVILMGRLTKDVEVRYSNSGKCVAQFTLAVDRAFNNAEGQKEADFIPVVFWGKPAETIGNYVSKGQRLLVEGRLQTRSYDAKDGSKRYVTEVIGNRFTFVEKRENSNNGFMDMGAEAPSGEVPFGDAIPF